MTGSRLTGSAPLVGDCKCELEPYAVQGLFELNCSSPWVGDCKIVEMPDMPNQAGVELFIPVGRGLQGRLVDLRSDGMGKVELFIPVGRGLQVRRNAGNAGNCKG